MSIKNRPTNGNGNKTEAARIRRIIVGFAGSCRGEALVDISATFAHAFRASLKGIYIRERALLNLAQLPFTTVTGAGLHTSRSLNANKMEQAWAREESSYRHALSQRATSQQIRWSFETANGNIEACLRESVTDNDIVVLATEMGGPTKPIQAQELMALAHAAHGVLIVNSKQTRLQPGPVLAINDEGPSSERLLSLANSIARAVAQPLEVLNTPSRSQVTSPTTLAQQLHGFKHMHGKSWREFMRASSPSLVVAHLSMISTHPEAEIRALLDRFKTPILLFTEKSALSSD